MNVRLEQLPDKTDKPGEAPVFLSCCCNSTLLKYFTKEKCLPKSWDKDKGEFKRSLPGYQEAQDYPDTLEEKVRKAYRAYRQQGVIPAKVQLKEAFEPESPKEPSVQEPKKKTWKSCLTPGWHIPGRIRERPRIHSSLLENWGKIAA